MEAHGPWLKSDISAEISAHLPPLPASVASDELARLLYHLQHTDQMFGDLRDLTPKLERKVVLALYGDHLPLLTQTFERAGFDEIATDYVIWCGEQTKRRDNATPLAPQELGREVLTAAGLIDGPKGTGFRTVQRPQPKPTFNS
jgi:hypothetical protein